MPQDKHIRLSRIGSDGEFSFATPIGPNKVQLFPAPHLVGEDKDARLRSFIGTDGHANTAEIRPAPCHNVQWHLAKIADAMYDVATAMNRYSERKLHGNPLVAVAQPSLGEGETMGGHIWVSMYYESAIAKDVINGAGSIWNNDTLSFERSGTYIMDYKKVGPGRIQSFRDRCTLYDELSLDECWKKLHWLIQPLEMMLFGSWRAHRGVVKDPFVRLPNNPVKLSDAMVRPGNAYVLFEYRYPSTWLALPILAFSYLGLAKLAILNWNNLPHGKNLSELIRNTEINIGQANPREYWKACLDLRLSALLKKPDFVLSKDLQGLPDAIHTLMETPLKSPLLINFESWSELRP